MTIESALVCSSSPGFLRCISGQIIGQCRMAECYSISEIDIMARNQEVDCLALDARELTEHQLARVFALSLQLELERIVLVTNPEQIHLSTIPHELMGRVIISEVVGTTADWDTIGKQILSSAAEQTDSSASMEIDTASPTSVDQTQQNGTRPKPESQTSEPNSRIANQFRTRTPELRRMLQRLEVAARHPVTMLLIGETGAGKTHLASLIHSISPQSEHPFVHVACGALPGELIESELFGHKKGSFTGAHADKEGKFVAAGRGTILLDEIDVMTPDQQVKLLRVIEKSEFEPVGSNETQGVEARIIAASNLPLQPLVEQGRFRPDLYYRLNTLSFVLPPLRKRLPDIEPLAKHFVRHHANLLGVEIEDISEGFVEALLHYPWPGNVRELENAIRSAVIYSDGGEISESALPPHILSGTTGPANDPAVSGFFSVRRGESLENRMELTEKEVIEQALLKNNFSRTNTARNLGISRVTLYNKMRKYGMLRKN